MYMNVFTFFVVLFPHSLTSSLPPHLNAVCGVFSIGFFLVSGASCQFRRLLKSHKWIYIWYCYLKMLLCVRVFGSCTVNGSGCVRWMSIAFFRTFSFEFGVCVCRVREYREFEFLFTVRASLEQILETVWNTSNAVVNGWDVLCSLATFCFYGRIDVKRRFVLFTNLSFCFSFQSSALFRSCQKYFFACVFEYECVRFSMLFCRVRFDTFPIISQWRTSYAKKENSNRVTHGIVCSTK